MKLVLPWPPSVNEYWHHTRAGKTYIAPAGRDYCRRVAFIVMDAGRPRLGLARIKAVVMAFPPDRRRRDLDNINKALWDSLQAAGVYEDDCQIDDKRIVRCAVEPPGRLEVSLEIIPEIGSFPGPAVE